MIYFLEYDSAGNICIAGNMPQATMVPVGNMSTFGERQPDGTSRPMVDANGNNLSPMGLVIAEPVGITEDVYNTIINGGGVHNFMYDIATSTVVPKATNAQSPATP
jgi:hypothetical protein